VSDLKAIFPSFQSSLKRLEEVIAAEDTPFNRDAGIQRFEFTVELAWKCIQSFMKNQNIICRSPNECLKEAFQFGLMEDDPLWLEMLKDRNLTSHTYHEETALLVLKKVPIYLKKLQELGAAIEKESLPG
jgi:nucleotidyltransferase substrate binding protein (TIGR01987 family)